MTRSLSDSKTRAAALFFVVGACALPGLAQPDSGKLFALDTLTLESARAADSARRAARDSAAAATGTAAVAEDTASSAALEGTREGRGSLSGRVVSEARGKTVAGVRVIVTGRGISAETDDAGRFGFPDLEPGTYSLFLVHSSYAPLTADGFIVTAGDDASRRLALPDKALQGEAVRITGSAAKVSEAGMLFAQKNAPSVSDGISSEQISKSPDGDAAAALKRVTGISLGGDGLVYVRGLGERYVNMQLNGLTISSPNPEKRVVPLDLFPTSLLENLSVSKTFTADQPAEFAGGSLQLRTKSYPDKRLISFSAGVGYDPGATFETFRTYKGGRFDFLGIDDGTRAVPGVVPEEPFDDRTANLGSTVEERQARQRAMLAAIPNTWTPYETRAPLNQSYALALGNKIPLAGGRTFGWLLGANYSAKWKADEEFSAKIGLDADTQAVYTDKYTNEKSTESIQWGVLGTATYQDGLRHKYRFNYLMNRDWEDEVTRLYGRRESDNDTSLVFEIANAQQTLLNGQLEGEHLLGDDGMKATWMAAMTGASRWEPDRRVSKYFIAHPEDSLYNPDFPFVVAATGGLQDRFWFELQERGWGGKADVEIPVEFGGLEEGTRVRAGAFLFGKDRTFDVRRLSYIAGSSLANSPLRYGNHYEDYFGAFNGASDSGYITNFNQSEKDNYEVSDLQWALHGQGDLKFSDSWRGIVGLRFVSATVKGIARSPQGDLTPAEAASAQCGADRRCRIPFGYEAREVLPAVSLVYSMTERQNVRTSWTRTFSFPEYREMAPLLFYSYENSEETVGNIDLKPTDIQNYDFRWEWFPSATELLAVSAFYKHFEDPVELSLRQISSNNRAEFRNAPSAQLFGLETEARLDLERLHETLYAFQLLGNVTLIRSEVEGKRKRSMQGQSPYLLNAILFFDPWDGRTQMSLLYNRYGRRIAKVGADIFPDVYEEPRESLEFAYTQRFGKRLKSKFTAKNLTNAAAVQTQGGLVTKKSLPGTSYSLGLTYAF